MRFEIGDKVEVVNDEELPVSWIPAEVLFISGHNEYLVQHDFFPGMPGNRKAEMVSKESVRPHPPPTQGVESCIAGDIVEVFYQYSWKVGTILGIMGGKQEFVRNKTHQKQYLVRLIGCSEDLVIGESNIRVRRTWDDEKWILMGKSSHTAGGVISTKPSTLNNFRRTNFQTPQYKSRASNRPPKTQTLTRTSPYGSTILEPHNRRVQKLRAIKKDKVDVVDVYPKEIMGRKNMRASSFNIKLSGFSEMERKHVLAHSGVKSSELISSDTDACSVGSCDLAMQCLNTLNSGRCVLNGDDGSDAESFYSSVPAGKKEFQVSVRELELHAYRTTLEALYASGPLSWEQEAMLTNLRIMLHISNDEHLKELKHLISPKTGVCAIR